MSTCAWCDKRIPDDSEVFGLGVKARHRIGITGREGKVIPVVLALVDKTVPAIVTTGDSQAKRNGYDLLFMCCSRECAGLLKDVLQEERNLFDEIRALGLSADTPP